MKPHPMPIISSKAGLIVVGTRKLWNVLSGMPQEPFVKVTVTPGPVLHSRSGKVVMVTLGVCAATASEAARNAKAWDNVNYENWASSS